MAKLCAESGAEPDANAWGGVAFGKLSETKFLRPPAVPCELWVVVALPCCACLLLAPLLWLGGLIHVTFL